MTLNEIYTAINSKRSPLTAEISLHDLRHNSGYYRGRTDGRRGYEDNDRHRELFFFRTLHVPEGSCELFDYKDMDRHTRHTGRLSDGERKKMEHDLDKNFQADTQRQTGRG